MLETKTKIIDGLAFSCTQFPGTRGIWLKYKIITKFGPSLAAAFSGSDFSKGIGALNIDPIGIGYALEKLGITPDEFVQLLTEILASTQVVMGDANLDMNKATIDMEFGGDRMPTLYKAALFALEANYGNFFGPNGFGSLIKKPKTARGSENSSQKASP